MKKAKEYANEIIETYVNKNEKEAHVKAAEIIKLLFLEEAEIRKARNINPASYHPLLAILKEQHLKWVAISRKVNKEINLLNERAFLEIIQERMTMIYPNLIKIL